MQLPGVAVSSRSSLFEIVVVQLEWASSFGGHRSLGPPPELLIVQA